MVTTREKQKDADRLIYLGHAGWMIEGPEYILLMDPWVSGNGAFLGAWFPYPYNDYLEDFIIKKISHGLPVFVYISHEHEDHLDLQFLEKIKNYNITFIIPNFKTKNFLNYLTVFKKPIIEVRDSERCELKSFSIRVFVEDSGINHDSAILYESTNFNFFNMNDCKLYDRLKILDLPKINFFTTQFSGATWHPTCYEFDENYNKGIASKKKWAKFRQVKSAIDFIQPDCYLTSAGPCVFLHPFLYPLNDSNNTIFPKAEEFLQYLCSQKEKGYLQKTSLRSLHPGESINLGGKIVPEAEIEYITNEEYQAKKFDLFSNKTLDKKMLTVLLHKFLMDKLACWTSSLNTQFKIYFGILDHDEIIRVDLNELSAQTMSPSVIENSNVYIVRSEDFAIEALINGALTWENFCLTFFHKIKRIPDKYDTLVNLFFFSSNESLTKNLEFLENIEKNKEEITVEWNGSQYKCHRFCPHQGADLINAKIENGYLVCPRHNWRFNLAKGGVSESQGHSICAVKVESCEKAGVEVV